MFYECSLLSNINALKHWNVSSGVGFTYMFYNCNGITVNSLDALTNWKVSNDSYFENIFQDVPF